MSKYQAVRSLIIEGKSLREIQRTLCWENKLIEKFFKSAYEDLVRFNHIRCGVSFGSKTEPYYDGNIYSEEDLLKIPKYSISELSKEEKKLL